MVSNIAPSCQLKSDTHSLGYMHVPNCAWTATIGKLGRCRRRNTGVVGKFAGLRHVLAKGQAA